MAHAAALYAWQACRLYVIRFRELIYLSFNCTDSYNIFILIFNLISILYLLQVVFFVYFMMLSQLTLDGTEWYDDKWKNYWNTCARKQSFPDVLFQDLFICLFISSFIYLFERLTKVTGNISRVGWFLESTIETMISWLWSINII